MTLVAAFSTDWTSSPVIDEVASRIVGRPRIVPGKVRMDHGGTFWYRGSMPLMEMARHTDYEVYLSWRFQTMPDGHIEAMTPEGEWKSPDILYTQRWMHEDGAEQFRRAIACGQKVVSELDDDFWMLTKTNLAYSSTDPKNNSSFNRDHYWNNLKASSAITVSTESLRKRVEPLDVPTFVLRNAIDIERWTQNDPSSDSMISWIGGIQWRAHDLELLKVNGLPQFLSDYGLPVYHGGDSQVPGVPKFYEKVGIDPTMTQVALAPLCSIGEYPNLWKPVGVSLIPLEKVAFNKAKSALKQLESFAAGVPCIVSAGFPEQELLASEGAATRFADNRKPWQWRRHLEELLDPDVRGTEGARNRQIAEQHDIRIRWQEWADAYDQISIIQ